jgi:uncharacterized membrane protein YgcG
MKPKAARPGFVIQTFHALVAVACIALLSPGSALLLAQTQPAAPPAAEPAPETPKIPNDQLDSLVAPIALYPDPLLAQTLAAATYPLEIIQLQQWLTKNPTLKDKALAEAVAKQDWDPSIQAMAALPDAVKQLSENIAWTSDLGNAFLAQQSDVMDAVQRMRAKAQGAGNLKTSKEQKVESKEVEGKTVVVIEQADPQTVYVPSYNPTAVYGPPAYPYPPITYPTYTGTLLAFGTGIAIGAAWNGGWGWGCGWGNNDVNVNVTNNYVNNFNKNNVNNRISNNSSFKHDPKHRGGAPYANRTTADKYGGNVRGDAKTNRPAADRSSQGPAADRKKPSGDRPSQGPAADRSTKAQRPETNRQQLSSGGDRVGNREVPKSPGASDRSALSGPSGGMNRSSAQASQSRGSHSMGGSRGGGSSGGGRSGGGRRR